MIKKHFIRLAVRALLIEGKFQALHLLGCALINKISRYLPQIIWNLPGIHMQKCSMWLVERPKLAQVMARTSRGKALSVWSWKSAF